MKFKFNNKKYIWKIKNWQAYTLFVLGIIGVAACVYLPAMVGTAWGL